MAKADKKDYGRWDKTCIKKTSNPAPKKKTVKKGK